MPLSTATNVIALLRAVESALGRRIDFDSMTLAQWRREWPRIKREFQERNLFSDAQIATLDRMDKSPHAEVSRLAKSLGRKDPKTIFGAISLLRAADERGKTQATVKGVNLKSVDTGNVLRPGYKETQESQKQRFNFAMESIVERSRREAGFDQRNNMSFDAVSGDYAYRQPIGVAEDFVAQRRIKSLDTGNLLNLQKGTDRYFRTAELDAGGAQVFRTPSGRVVSNAQQDARGNWKDPVTGEPAMPFTGRESQLPRYFEGDQYQPAGMSPENIAQIQRRLVLTGALQDFRIGVWDENTAKGYYAAMSLANQAGVTVDVAMGMMARGTQQERDAIRQQLINQNLAQLGPYVKPDYDTLAHSVRGLIESELDRDASEGEMAELTAAMERVYRAEYASQQQQVTSSAGAAADAAWDQPTRNIDEFIAGKPMTTKPLTMAPIQGHDPAASMAELFRKKFANEINNVERRDDLADAGGRFIQSLSGMDQMMGQGSVPGG